MSARSNPLLYTSQKLSGEWSAANFAALDADMANKLFDEWPKLDTGVRMRILLSTLFMTQQQRDDIRDPMHRLIDRAIGSGEEDDWVKVMAHAVQQLNGQLDLPAVAHSIRDVDTGLATLASQMQAECPTGYPALETPYLNTRLVPPGLLELAGQQRQRLPFAVRDGADAALCAGPLPAEGQPTGAPAVDQATPGHKPEGGRGGRHAPAADAVDGGMFRSASTAARGLPSRRSSVMVGQERRAKVMTLPTDRALALAKSGKLGKAGEAQETPPVEEDAPSDKRPRLDGQGTSS